MSQVTPLPRGVDTLQAISRNRVAAEVLIDYTTLPYSGPIVYRPEAVYIHVATIEDVARWLHTLREHGVPGRITVEQVGHGLEAWVLHTHTPPGRDRYQAPLRVHTTAPAGTVLPADLDTPEAVA